MKPIDVLIDPGLSAGVQPMGLGLPMPQGKLEPSQVSTLAVVGESSGAVPACFEVRASWPDGTVKWLWVDFEGDVAGHYQVKKLPGAKPKQLHHVIVFLGVRIYVQTGQLTVTFDLDKATPVEVYPAGKGTIIGDGAGAYVIDNRNRRAVAAGSLAELDWKVETDNGQRAVLRVKGWYVTGDGDRIARLVLRYDFRAGQPWFTVEHRRIVTKNTAKLWFTEEGITFPGQIDVDTMAQFGVDGKTRRMTADGARCFQSDYRRWTIAKTGCDFGADDDQRGGGKIADGWVDAGGMVVAVKDFAQQFPKELYVDPRGVTAKLWSARSGIPLDYKPSTLVKRFWGVDLFKLSKWRERERGKRLSFAEKLMLVTDVEDKACNAYGSARTHHIFCGYYSGPADMDRTKAWNDTFQQPAVALPDPRWSVATGAVPPIMAENATRFPTEEAYISAAFDGYMAQMEDCPPVGYYDWGAGPGINYSRTWVPGETSEKSLPEIFRLGNLDPYNATRHIWYLWLRSGDRKYLDVAERQSRILADFRFSHYGTDKGMVDVAMRELPVYWAKGWYKLRAMVSTDSFAPMSLAYHLRDDRHALDVIEAFNEAVNAHWTVSGAHMHAPDVRIQQLTSVWEVTQDSLLVEKIRYLARGMVDSSSQYGLDLDFYWHEKPDKREWRAHYKRPRKFAALCEYLSTFGPDPIVESAMLRATADDLDYMVNVKALTYQNYTAALLAMAYRLTGESKYREFAAEIVAKAIRDHLLEDGSNGVQSHTQMFPFYVVPQLLGME